MKKTQITAVLALSIAEKLASLNPRRVCACISRALSNHLTVKVMSIFLNTQYGKTKLTPRQILSDPVLFLAFGFGSGLAKKAPGTFGTLAAIPVYWLVCASRFAGL